MTERESLDKVLEKATGAWHRQPAPTADSFNALVLEELKAAGWRLL